MQNSPQFVPFEMPTITNFSTHEMPIINFVKTHEDAILPRKAHPHPYTGDTGFDLFTVEDITIPAKGSTVAPVGLKLAFITPGYWFRIEPRSGLGFKKNIQPHLGIIDNPYRGDMGVKLYNFGDTDVTINKGVAIAQFAIYELITANVKFVDEVTATDRGEKGFGSTGI